MITSFNYTVLGIWAVLIILLLFLAIVLWKLIGAGGPLAIFDKRSVVPEPYKYVPYETAEHPVGRTRFPFNIEYYVFPILFMVFDVFMPIMYLWVVYPNGYFSTQSLLVLVSFLVLLNGMFISVYRFGRKVLDSETIKKHSEIAIKAAEGDEKALEEFLRIEPLPVYRELKPEEMKAKPLEQRLEEMHERIQPKKQGGILKPIRNALRKILGPIFKWGLAKSPWIPYLGIKCCALEVPMAVGVSRFDMERFGVVPSPSPRHVDILIVNGPVTKKYAQKIKILYDQMAEPKFVVALGECAIIGGPFKESYSLIHGVNKIIPVDFYVPGCPPRPETFLEVLIAYRDWVQKGKVDYAKLRSIRARRETKRIVDEFISSIKKKAEVVANA